MCSPRLQVWCSILKHGVAGLFILEFKVHKCLQRGAECNQHLVEEHKAIWTTFDLSICSVWLILISDSHHLVPIFYNIGNLVNLRRCHLGLNYSRQSICSYTRLGIHPKHDVLAVGCWCFNILAVYANLHEKAESWIRFHRELEKKRPAIFDWSLMFSCTMTSWVSMRNQLSSIQCHIILTHSPHRW